MYYGEKIVIMNYSQIEEYILNIPKFSVNSCFEETKKFYEFLGKPGTSASIIHVAGTNGKGSTCAYMNSVLTEAGVKTGMFTSPHLVSVRERMRINNLLISEDEFVSVYLKLLEKIERYNQTLKENVIGETIALEKKHLEQKDGEMDEKIALEKKCLEEKEDKTAKTSEENSYENYVPTFYEVLFFMAMLYFEEQKTQVIILETGLGGRLDATNVIDTPKVVVITEIGKDHMEYLGDNLEQIAEEKAGIIKAGTKVVYSRKRQDVTAVIERKIAQQGALCKCVEKLEEAHYRFVDKMIDFSFFSRYYGYIPIILSTCALYQIENARLALSALEELEIEISVTDMQNGMIKCKWEGRMEEILPGVFLDGAHNEDGIAAFIATVKQDQCQGKRWLLFSAVADKEYVHMKETLIASGLFGEIYAAPLNHVRRIDKERLEEIFSVDSVENGIRKENSTEHKIDYVFHDYKVRIVDKAWEGLEDIISLKKEEDFVYVTGSLYLIGEIKERRNPNEKDMS